MKSDLMSVGLVSIIAEYLDGTMENLLVKNRVLSQGRANLVKALANKTGGTFEFYISAMQFGSGGTVGGTPRYVEDVRAGLFGPTLATKGVIASIDPDVPTNVTFTSVLTFDELVGQIINEMGLQMKNGDLYSMTTFGDISKTSSMQLTFNWEIRMI